MSWRDWLPATQGDLKNLWSFVMDQTDHITRIGEITMARVDELRERLAAATDELANDLAALRDEVAGLDQAVADKFSPLVERLEAMGRDPQDPVPDAPADGGVDTGTGGVGGPGDGDVVNPTPGAEDNPNR